MPKFSLQNSQTLFRALVLFGVLAGLLFSCGEGIRLFPFPPQASANESSGWKSGKATVYQKNLHRFENKQGNPASKIQRGDPHHYWTDAASAPQPAPLLSFFAARRARVLFNRGVFKSRLFSFSRSSRAPPFAS